MQLKSIRLSGFKSFANATSLELAGNRTCLVGPNGSGKSNLVDALRWVCGESSAARLRGGQLADVIFAGTASRRRAGRAAVELAFDNSEDELGPEWARFPEVVVRRVQVSGEPSEFFINNNPVRRRDLIDLLRGTGLILGGYGIVEQGMIADIAEASPQQLGRMVEEAAGISRYRERRAEAEARLGRTEDNLVQAGLAQAETERNYSRLRKEARAAELQQGLARERDLIKLQLLNGDRARAAQDSERNEGEWRRACKRAAALVKRRDAGQERLKTARDTERRARSEVERRRREFYRAEAELEQQQMLGRQLAVLQSGGGGGAKELDPCGQEAAIGRWIRDAGLEDQGVLADSLRVEEGWEQAFESVLGPWLQARVVETVKAPPKVLSAAMPAGAMLLRPHDGKASLKRPPKTDGTLASRCGGPFVPKFLTLVRTVEDAAAAWELLPSLKAGMSVVSRDGLWLGPGWARSAAPSGKGVAGQVPEDEAAALERDLKQALGRLQREGGVLKGKGAAIETGEGGEARAVAERLRQARVEIDRAEGDEAAATRALEGLEERLRLGGTDYEGALEARLSLEMEVRTGEATRRQLDKERQQLLESLTGAVVAEADLAAAIGGDGDEAAIEQARRRLASLERRLERAGPQNWAAAEAIREGEQRVEQVRTQVKDLESSVASLRAGILEIEKSIDRALGTSLAAINGHLQTFFGQLFSGGSAELAPLPAAERGDRLFRYKVNFAGRRIRSLAMLSGGEKSLAALALVFSFFRMQPAGFCVLDEVDAALDEASIGNYLELLRQLSAESQFLLITHNALTMEQASHIYGVAMREAGVSRLVSVDVERALELAGRSSAVAAEAAV